MDDLTPAIIRELILVDFVDRKHVDRTFSLDSREEVQCNHVSGIFLSTVSQ